MNSAWWVVAWFVLAIVFCALFVPGSDPFVSLCVMGFGAASFALGNLFAKARRGSDIIDKSL
jgi:hypothetical protein